MTVSNINYKNRHRNETREYLFIFTDFETLTSGILFLYQLKRCFKSVLYKTEKEYCLIITTNSVKPFFLTLNEYCRHSSRNIFEIAHTKEYGKLLIQKNAIKTFGKYFFKDL